MKSAPARRTRAVRFALAWLVVGAVGVVATSFAPRGVPRARAADESETVRRTGVESTAHAPLAAGAELPPTLHATGLYADAALTRLAPDLLVYEPQYPLWTDGATKRRWMRLPAGTSIDASDVDHWVFPRGTQLWKEFSFGRRVETRYMTLDAGGTWRFATYAWDADERAAVLAPERGVAAACEAHPGVPFDVPARMDCAACHAAGPNVVLGVSALQLSPDRDPLAPHAVAPGADAVDLNELVRRGLVRGLPAPFVGEPPRIRARSPRERAALGYLHANCGMCHTSSGALAGLGLDLSYPLAMEDAAPALATALDQPSRFRWPSDADPLRLASAHPDRSVLLRRMASTQPLSRMPPLGTRVRDEAALDLVTNWLRDDLSRARRPVTDSLPDETRQH